MECTTLLAGARSNVDTAAQQAQPAYHTHYSTDSASECLSDLPVQLTQRQNKRASDGCGNCGSKSHTSKAQQCPARGQTCRNCLKQNHFAKVCRSAPATLQKPTSSSSGQHAYTEIFAIVDGHRCGCITAKCKFFSHLPLENPATALCGYNCSKIDILGVLHVPVHYGSKHLPSFTFHIARWGDA